MIVTSEDLKKKNQFLCVLLSSAVSSAGLLSSVIYFNQFFQQIVSSPLYRVREEGGLSHDYSWFMLPKFTIDHIVKSLSHHCIFIISR